MKQYLLHICSISLMLMAGPELAQADVKVSSALIESSNVAETVQCKNNKTGAIENFGVHDFDTGSLTLRYAEGPSNGPTLVLIPGMGGRWQTYSAAAKDLCQHFRLVLLDQRGHGASGWAKDKSYRVVDYGRDVEALVEKQLGGPVIISGHSLGGLVALWLAANRPDLVSGLDAEDAPYLMSELPRWNSHWVKPLFASWEQRLRAYQENGRSYDAARHAFEEAGIGMPRVDVPYESRVRALGKQLTLNEKVGAPVLSGKEQKRIHAAYAMYLSGKEPKNKDFLPDAVIEQAVRSSLHMDPEVVGHAVSGRLNDGFNHIEAFRRVRAPVLFWQSDRDLVGVLPQQDIDMLVGILREHVRVRYVYEEGIGHQIHNDATENFASELISFFGE